MNILALFCSVALFFTASSIHADPLWEKIIPGRRLELRLADATMLAPEILNVPSQYLRMDVQKKMEERPSATRASWVWDSLIEASEKDSLTIDKHFSALLKRWFSHAQWVDDLDQGITGIAPEGVAIVLDDQEPLHVWIIQYWKGVIRLRVGYNCGSEFYQVLPQSKVVVLKDEQCRNHLLKLLTRIK